MATPGVSEPAGVDLLGQPVTKRRRGQIRAWGERYGYSRRQIMNWRADGIAAQLPCPLDSPDRMPEWFAAVYSKAAPSKLLAAIERLTSGAALVPASADSPPPAAKPAIPVALEPLSIPEIDPSNMTSEMSLQRARRGEALYHMLGEEALGKNEISRAKSFFDQAQAFSAEARQLEKALPALKEAAGEWMRTAEVKRATVEFLTILRRALETRGIRAADRLRNQSSDAAINALWIEEIRAVFVDLCAADFSDLLVLSPE